MDNNSSEAKQRNRRRKRAQRMQAIREKQDDNKDDSGEEDENNGTKEKKPQRPPCRRKKVKEKDFLAEEDIIDGFAILAFKTYEDLEVSGPLCVHVCVCVCLVCHSTRRRCRISATVSSSWIIYLCCVLCGSASGSSRPLPLFHYHFCGYGYMADDGRYSCKNPAVCAIVFINSCQL